MMPSGATAVYKEGPLLEVTFYILFHCMAIFRCGWVRLVLLLQCGGLL
jgi:hypothetical protein